MRGDRAVVKTFTRARKFPQLIGRTPDGRRIWGGPYTTTQFVGAGVVAFVLWQSTALWARWGLIGNSVFFGAVTFGVVWGLGRLPLGGRCPLSMAMGAGRAVVAPMSSSRASGRVLRTHSLAGTVTLVEGPPRRPVLSPPGSCVSQGGERVRGAAGLIALAGGASGGGV